MDAEKLLPEILHPLWRALEWMRRELVHAYFEFEKSFDGSKIGNLYMELAPYLVEVVLSAGEVNVKPNVLNTKLEGAEVEFDTV